MCADPWHLRGILLLSREEKSLHAGMVNQPIGVISLTASWCWKLGESWALSALITWLRCCAVLKKH